MRPPQRKPQHEAPAMQQLALFPLHTVLFPGGRLPLQIFEARYLDMVSQCLKENSRFVIVLIRDGDEVVTDSAGTHARSRRTIGEAHAGRHAEGHHHQQWGGIC